MYVCIYMCVCIYILYIYVYMYIYVYNSSHTIFHHVLPTLLHGVVLYWNSSMRSVTPLQSLVSWTFLTL